MTSVKSPQLVADATTRSKIRRKPTTTYPSPAANISANRLEGFLAPYASSPSHNPTSALPKSKSSASTSMRNTQVPRQLDLTEKPSHHRIPPFLPLYHPLGALALSLPDLDPTVFGLPAPVAILDDPTRRSSNRTRRPAAKIRDADDAAVPSLPFTDVTPTPDSAAEPGKDKPSPRRKRPSGGGGGGNRRRRREADDGDATYPAKRPRHPRSSGMAPAVAPTRTPSAEDVSPPPSLAHTALSPVGDVSQGSHPEERRPERRTTRSRGALVRRDSTASVATVTSVAVSVAATNGVAQNAPNGAVSTEGEHPVAIPTGINKDHADPAVHAMQEM